MSKKSHSTVPKILCPAKQKIPFSNLIRAGQSTLTSFRHRQTPTDLDAGHNLLDFSTDDSVEPHRGQTKFTPQSATYRDTPKHAGITSRNRSATLLTQRMAFLTVDANARKKIERMARRLIDRHGGWPGNVRSQFFLARPMARYLRKILPTASDLLSDQLVNARVDAVSILGLPSESDAPKLVMLALTLMLGSPFNFKTQNDGQIVMVLSPSPNARENTNATPGEFAMHTDDAAAPRACRPHFISLYGLVNPPETYTYYAPLTWAITEMSKRDAEQAQHDFLELGLSKFSVRFPDSLGAGEVWVRGRPVITLGVDGTFELGFPSYNIRPDDSNDTAGKDSLDRLHRALESVKQPVAIDPGVFLAFSNLRGTHSRDRLGTAERKILRTYANKDLRDLRKVTGVTGPIFPIDPIVSAALGVELA